VKPSDTYETANVALPLDPTNARLAAGLRAGEVCPELATRLTEPQTVSPRTRREISEWLRTGSLEPLKALLAARPWAVGHPTILRELRHLLKLLYVRLSPIDSDGELAHQTGEPEDIVPVVAYGEVSDPQHPHAPEGLLPPEVQIAQSALHQLVAAWVSGLLPGWTIAPEPVPRRRGRKPASDPVESLVIALAYNRLQELVRGRTLTYRRSDEGPEARATRLAAAITNDLNLGSGATLIAYGRHVSVHTPKAPPAADRAEAIARAALRKGRLVHSALVYGLSCLLL
jgi:hypothetical protein